MGFLQRMFAPGKPVERKYETITTSAGLANHLESTGGYYDASWSIFSRANIGEVYRKNPIAYQCVNLIASQLASVDLIIKRDDTEIEDRNHPYVKLVHRPNYTTAGPRFFQELASHLLLYGNAYIDRSALPGDKGFSLLKRGKGELRLLNPALMNIESSGKQFADTYRYNSGGEQKTYNVNSITGEVDNLLHLKTFNPLDQYYGMPAVSAAYLAVLNHNAGQEWNRNQLINNAVPAAALVLRDGAAISEEQATQIRDGFNRLYSGAQNSGKTAVLAEMDIELLGTDPTKMQYIEGQEAAARNIALALGVSPMLLGLPGDNTFSNFAGANEALYQQRVLPLLDYVLTELSNWMSPVFGEDFMITYDPDSVEALESARSAKWQSLKDVSFLTINEKRASLGYDPVPNGDQIIGVSPTNPAPTNGLDPNNPLAPNPALPDQQVTVVAEDDPSKSK